MQASGFLRNIMVKAGIPALSLIFMGFFAYNATLGPNGLLHYRDYSEALAAKQAKFAALDKHRAELRNRVRLLDSKHVDPDLADELARRELGVVNPDEVVILLDKKKK